MDIDQVKTILKKNETKNYNDSRQILKNKNNVMHGNEIGVVLSIINNNLFEVFIHAKIDNEVFSQILYSTFNTIIEANEYYDKLLKYIINYDIEGIIAEIKN